VGIGSHSSRATAVNVDVTDCNAVISRTRSIVAVFVAIADAEAEAEIVNTADAVFVDAALTIADCSRTRSHAEVVDADAAIAESPSRTFVAEHDVDDVAVTCVWKSADPQLCEPYDDVPYAYPLLST